MAAVVDVEMTNNDNSKKFLFRAVVPFSNRKFQPSIRLPLINTTPANSVIFRFTGQAQDINFTFAIFDDGTDVSSGTEGGGVTTVDKQVQYIMDTFYTEDFDVDWTLSQSRHFSSDITGVIDSITLDNPAGAGTIITGTLVFKRGRIGAL